ncbi:hypothetical protein CDL15_Pgr003395 [Punica granatum]|uniref:Cyclase-like protein 2 n=1 Tax=Punica granatum TaxID=22663 RepID=A0A218X2P3_PUNGR|nr:hypothetical protein CDL15_Pgr003395 [Punica granatum]
MKNGSSFNYSIMKLHDHTGTHVDAPGHYLNHYFKAGFDVDTGSSKIAEVNLRHFLTPFLGPAPLIDVPRDKNITAEVMESLKIPRGVRRMLFGTLNTDRGLMYENFFTSFVRFKEDGTKWLVENTDVKLIGRDLNPLLSSGYFLVFLRGNVLLNRTLQHRTSDGSKTSRSNVR